MVCDMNASWPAITGREAPSEEGVEPSSKQLTRAAYHELPAGQAAGAVSQTRAGNDAQSSVVSTERDDLSLTVATYVAEDDSFCSSEGAS